MKTVAAWLALALCSGVAQAQTFVPRFDRPALVRNGESTQFGTKSDLETSMGRVAEAPRLMPKGASATMSSDDEPAASTSSTAQSGLASVAIATAVLALGTVGWRLWLRSQGP